MSKFSDFIPADMLEVYAKLDKFNKMLNQRPPQNWIKKDEDGIEYLPIDRVEYLLKKIFMKYKIEILGTKQILNSVEVTVRLHYYHPVLKEWMYHDGVGVREIMTNKGTGILKPDFTNLQRTTLKKILGAAKSVAERNAAKHLGKIFGGSLNKENIEYELSEDLQQRALTPAEERESIINSIKIKEPVKIQK